MSLQEPPADQVQASPLPQVSLCRDKNYIIHCIYLEAPEEREGMALKERKNSLVADTSSSLQTWWLHHVTGHSRAHSWTPGWLRDAGLSCSCWMGFPTSSSCLSMFPVSHIMSPKWELSMKHREMLQLTQLWATTSELQSTNPDSQTSSQKKKKRQKKAVFNKMQC